MTDREYLIKLAEAIPEEKLDDAIAHLMSYSDDDFDEKKFSIAKDYVLEKYREAFEELAK